MVLGTWLGLAMRGGTVVLSVVLELAFAADTLSIAVMEVVDNTVVVLIPGAMAAGATSLLFWISPTSSLAVAFVITLPVNKWMIGRGQGHAVVHQLHHS